MARNCDFCNNQTEWGRVLVDDRILCPGCETIEFLREFVTLGGDYSGKRFEPLPWFEKFCRVVFGTLTDEGLRRIEDVYLEIPKGNAKTTSIAALVILFLMRAETTGTEIYSAATTKKQAANTYRAAEQMVRASPFLNARLKCITSLKRIVRRDDPTSFYEALSCDGDKHDGFAPSFVVRDELHLWRTKAARALFAVLEKSAATKRLNPLVIDITTAGVRDESEMCWARHQYTLDWQAGAITDRRFYGCIYAADQKRMDEEELYWTTMEARIEANPAHEANGGHIRDGVFEAMVVKALTDPVLKSEYQRYHLNYWGTHAEAVIEFPLWLKCNGGVDMTKWTHYDPMELVHEWDLMRKSCYLGLDIGSSRDLTALLAGFPPEGKRKAWAFLAWYWMPRSKVLLHTERHQIPYLDWVGRDFIEAHDEPRTNPLVVIPKIKFCVQIFNVIELCYDDWNADNLIRRVETGDERGKDAIDIACTDVDQNISQLNQPTKWLLMAYQNELIWHGNNPVLNWNARSLGVKTDSNNNMKPLKVADDNPKKIDGISAMVTLLRRGLAVENEGSGELNVRLLQ